MVKVSGPMFSLAASGSLAKTVVFSQWKGRPYVRELVKPSNPKSGLQVGMRAMWTFTSQRWANLTTVNQDSWNDLADQLVASPFNAFMKQNQQFWRDDGSPSQNSSRLQAATLGATPTTSATGGVRSVTLSIEVAIANQNWGVAIFRDPVTAFTPSLANCIKVIPLTLSATPSTFIDSPLAAGTYFYNYRLFTTDGVYGAALGEDTATVT